MHLQLEGPDIQELLAQIRSEHGPSARIVKADRVRSGGIAGFFAKEHFEVTVEVDDDAAPLPVQRNPSDDDADLSTAQRYTGRHAPTSDAANRESEEPDRLTGETEKTPISLADLIAAADAAEASGAPVQPAIEPVRPAPAQHQPMSAFESVLAAVAKAEQDQLEPALEVDQDTSLLLRHLMSSTSASDPDPALSLAEAEIAAVQERPAAPIEAAEEAAPPDEAAPEKDDEPADRVEPDGDEPEGVDAWRRATPVAEAAIAPSALDDAQSPSPWQQPPAAPTPTEDRSGSSLLSIAAAAGMPRSTLRRCDTDQDLLDHLAGLPRASTRRIGNGEVVAVVAEPGEAAAAAGRLMRRWRLRPDHVFGPGGHQTLPGDDDAERLARAGRASDNPTLLVLDAEFTSFDALWVQDVVAAARPDRVLAVVDASRKPADVDQWLAGIGISPDALIVVNLDQTATPAAVLELGLPIAELNGEPATPDQWVRLLRASGNRR